MSRTFSFLFAACLASIVSAQGNRSDVPPSQTFYAVSYVESMSSPAARMAAIAAFKQYRSAMGAQEGFVTLELFEQTGRPGHFAVVEEWKDQKEFEARDATRSKQLQDALQPIRVSGYDQRPYKPLSIGPATTPRTASQVTVIAHVDVAPNPQTPELLKQLAEASRRDEGNVRFDVMQHTMRANHFTVVETWRDQKSLDAHVAAAHTKRYRDELQPSTGSPLDERVYKLVS